MNFIAAILAAFISTGDAATNEVSMTFMGDLRCFTSNSTPDHEIGPFGGPNDFVAQTETACVDATPELTGDVVYDIQTSGITLSGLYMRPETADYYDASSARGFSRDSASGWKIEGMGGLLQMDPQNAHADERGLYHYHAVSDAVVDGMGDSTLYGYAADGFEIHYIGADATSSWQLIEGERPTSPGGAYDGSYVQDYEYVAGSGNLDECNGATVDGEYMYFATDTYPFFPRCFKGEVSDDFVSHRG